MQLRVAREGGAAESRTPPGPVAELDNLCMQPAPDMLAAVTRKLTCCGGFSEECFVGY